MVFGRRRERGTHGARQVRGQAAVEFALVLPFLLVLLLGTADFGRVFAAGIVVEGAARDAAEMVANDARMQLLKSPGCDFGCRNSIYVALHALAVKSACSEGLRLEQNAGFAQGGNPSECAGRLLVAVCIHDSIDAAPIISGDPNCREETGANAEPNCTGISSPPMSNVQDGPAVTITGGTSVPLRSVEVRLCYLFTPFITQAVLPFVPYNVGHVYIQRTRTFIVSQDY